MAGDFHFLNTMYEDEAVYTKLQGNACMSIVSSIDAYCLIISKLAPFGAVRCYGTVINKVFFIVNPSHEPKIIAYP